MLKTAKILIGSEDYDILKSEAASLGIDFERYAAMILRIEAERLRLVRSVSEDLKKGIQPFQEELLESSGAPVDMYTINAAQSQIYDNIQSICDYFAISESAHFQNYKLITEFINYLYQTKGIDDFEIRFNWYRDYKDTTQEYKPSISRFLGSKTKSPPYSDGQWCAENWERKLNDFVIKNQKRKSDGRKQAEREKVREYLGDQD